MFSERVQSVEGSSARDRARTDTRARVVAAAARCFDEAGYDATTVRGIAAEAGVSVGTVMANGDKRALLVAVFDSRIAELHARRPVEPGAVTPLASVSRSDRCADLLADLVAPFVALFAERPGLSRHYAAVLVSGAHRSDVFDELSWTLTSEFEAVLARRDAGRAAPADALRATSATLYAAYLGVLFAASGRGEMDGAQILDRLRTVFSVVVGEPVRDGEGS